ncbi:hypothetical protein OBJ95_06025 [Empedobacter falsenii]
MKYDKDLTKYKFGKLTPIKISYINKNHVKIWECKCDCGNVKDILRTSLITGNSKSCGCLVKEPRVVEKKPNHFCPCCNKKIYIKPSRLIKNKLVFCNMSCRTNYYNMNKNLIPTYKNRNDLQKFFDEKCTRLKMSARKRNIFFSNDLNGGVLFKIWNKQKGLCYYSKVKMSINKKDRLKLVSVDRIDSKKGYELDNIVLCTYVFNSFKFSFNHDEILNFINELKQLK